MFWVNYADSLGKAGLPDNFEQSSRPHGTGLTDDFFIAYPLLTEDIELKSASGSLLAATTPIPVHRSYISNSPASAFIDHA